MLVLMADLQEVKRWVRRVSCPFPAAYWFLRSLVGLDSRRSSDISYFRDHGHCLNLECIRRQKKKKKKSVGSRA